MQVLTAIDRDEIARLRDADEFFWLDLVDPGDDDLVTLCDALGLHRLVLEDLRERGQRPKIDDYDDYVLLVYYGARIGEQDRPELVEMELVISGGYVVSVHDGQLDELQQLRERFAAHPPRSEQFVVYRVVDALTDTFFPILSNFDDEIDRLENEVVANADEAQLQRIFTLKRDLVSMRKIVTPQRDLFARAGDDIIALPGLEPEARDHFRDVYDHLIRISDLIDSYRDLLTGAMDVYLSTVSNRLNVVMERLTLIATVFLPLTFITGFFGQNFGWLVGHIDTFAAFLVLGIGGVLVPALGFVIWFRRRGWI